MRYLTIVRHAKSTPAALGERDYDRHLSKRGIRQCEELRAWANDPTALGAFGPVTALVSAAARTRETYRRSFDETPLVAAVHFSELIYNGRRDVTAEDVLIDLAAIDPVTTSLMVVGHNPTLTELLYVLVGELPEAARDGFPLGGAFVLALRDDQPVGLTRYELVTSFVPTGAKRDDSADA